MSASKVKVAIALFVVIFVALPISFVVYYGDVNHYVELDELAQDYEANPSEDRLRDFLNYPSDGAYAYYHMALVGEAFSQNPRLFQKVAQDLKTDREVYWMHSIASYGDGVFEHYPELEPSGFDRQLEGNQHWLAAHKNVAEQGASSDR
ncbi:MAG: hypothetical protein H7A51_13825 [Akkermansiaceae bacterium]|nr:hypothetical protein [Akkermansiaceae bacterium]